MLWKHPIPTPSFPFTKKICHLMPNTHRRRRRDETIESRRVGGVNTNSQLVGDSFVVSSVWTHPSAVVTHWLQNCKLGHGRRLRCAFASPNPSAVVANSCTHRRRDATRRDKTVSSRQHRRCVLGFSFRHRNIWLWRFQSVCVYLKAWRCGRWHASWARTYQHGQY